MFKRNNKSVKKTPIKGEPTPRKKPETEKVETICSVCEKKRPYANKSKKICSTCVKKANIEKAREKKEKIRKKKSESVSVLIKKLDTIFSVYIRLYDTDTNGNCKCFTCNQPMFWRKIQCGHFQSRRFLSTRFHELNCKPQCYACNIGLSGNQYIFGVNLDKRYGQGTADEMVRISRNLTKYNAEELKILIDEFNLQVENLRKEKNIWT